MWIVEAFLIHKRLQQVNDNIESQLITRYELMQKNEMAAQYDHTPVIKISRLLEPPTQQPPSPSKMTATVVDVVYPPNVKYVDEYREVEAQA